MTRLITVCPRGDWPTYDTGCDLAIEAVNASHAGAGYLSRPTPERCRLPCGPFLLPSWEGADERLIAISLRSAQIVQLMISDTGVAVPSDRPVRPFPCEPLQAANTRRRNDPVGPRLPHAGKPALKATPTPQHRGSIS
jgi:hypothetical protein